MLLLYSSDSPLAIRCALDASWRDQLDVGDEEELMKSLQHQERPDDCDDHEDHHAVCNRVLFRGSRLLVRHDERGRLQAENRVHNKRCQHIRHPLLG